MWAKLTLEHEENFGVLTVSNVVFGQSQTGTIGSSEAFEEVAVHTGVGDAGVISRVLLAVLHVLTVVHEHLGPRGLRGRGGGGDLEVHRGRLVSCQVEDVQSHRRGLVPEEMEVGVAELKERTELENQTFKPVGRIFVCKFSQGDSFFL